MAQRYRQSVGGRALRVVRPVLRRLDVDVSRWSRSYAFQRVRYLRDAGIEAVVDVGANAGQYGTALRADGYRGRLLSIEPLASAFVELARCATRDPLWDCVRCGLGDRAGDAVLGVSDNGFSSSLLPILDSHVEAAPDSRVQRAQKVRLRTLDSVMGEWGHQVGPIALKLDVQGYEAQVLRGASGTLPTVEFLEIELSLVPLYEDQVLYTEMIEDVRALGYSLVNVETGFCDPRTGRVLQVDGIFLRGR